MRHAKIFAIATMFATVSALALPPTTTPSLKLVVSGSAAFTTTFATQISNVCQAGTLDTYSADGTPAPNMSAYSCTLSTQLAPIYAALRGLNAIVYFRTEGGSSYGAAPIEKNVQINRLLVNSLCTGATPTWTCPVVGWNIAAETGTGNIVKDSVELGLSEVEPARFVGDNWPGGFFGAEPTAAEIARVSGVRPLLGHVYSLYVNSSVSPSPISLSRAAVAAILEGSVTNWQAVPKLDGSGFVSSVSAPITVCNRDKGSGTRAAVGFFATGYGCISGGIPLVASTLLVNRSDSSEEICIRNGAGRIGYLAYRGLTPPVGTVAVNIDGIAPSLVSAALGVYGLWYEGTANNGAALTGNSSLLADLLIRYMRSGSLFPLNNSSLLALPFSNTPLLPVTSSSNPTAVATRGLQSCASLQTVF